MVVLFSLILLCQPTAGAKAKSPHLWVIETLAKEIAPIIIKEIHQVEDENGIHNGNEFSDPHYIMFDDEEFLIGNNPEYYYDKNYNGIVDRLSHDVVGMSYRNGFDIGATLNQEACKDIVDIRHYESRTGYHHAATLPYGSPDRIGNDRIYGGFFAFQGGLSERASDIHGWVGCTLGYSNISANDGKLVITPT
ncbi:hypothetical protein N8996_07155, partial [Candidatus Poseidonia alphae]|nr:hypothetical protein [Candidatus Poseidonia alphae]